MRQRLETASHAFVLDVPSTTIAHQSDRAGATTSAEQGVSQSTVICSTQSRGRSHDSEEDEIEEVDEDQLEGCSQETRDTIESWTA